MTSIIICQKQMSEYASPTMYSCQVMSLQGSFSPLKLSIIIPILIPNKFLLLQCSQSHWMTWRSSQFYKPETRVTLGSSPFQCPALVITVFSQHSLQPISQIMLPSFCLYHNHHLLWPELLIFLHWRLIFSKTVSIFLLELWANLLK